MEVTTGLGYMLGPLVGTLLYIIGDYSLPFYVFTGFFILSIPLATKMLPTDNYLKKMILNNNSTLSDE